MNLLGALMPTTRPVDLLDPVSNITAQVATAAAVKTLRVEADMSREAVRLLDPNAGRHLNRSA
jgi:hypothetical protein